MKNFSVATPAVIALAMVANGVTVKSANANEADATLQQISEYNQTQPMGQVTSVSQLRDVSPTDWAFEALRSLVENYGCIVGYPDRTFRGNRALSRYEFAAGLNACMQQMERLIASSQAVLREDIEKLKRLMAEFETELAALGARVDNLEGRVAFLEDHQFSTTTKLRGEVIFGVTAFGENSRGDGQATLSDRVRLSLDSSFTGKDRLRVRLAAGNVPRITTQTGNRPASTQARLSFEQNTPDNNVIADKVFYTAPLGDNFRFWAGTMMAVDDIYRAYSPYTESGGTGALSRAMRYNPVLYRSVGEAGVAAQYKFNSTFDITASYLAGNGNSAADPSRGNGLFNGVYSAGVQLGINPNKNLGFGLGYMFAYDNVNNIGGGLTPIGALNNRRDLNNLRVETHNVGIQGTWRVAEKFNISGWGGYSDINDPGSSANADLWTFAVNFSMLDLMKEGAVLNIGGGMLPYVEELRQLSGRTYGTATSWIVEGNYKYPVTDNISVTPGVYAVFNPNQTEANNIAVVGVLRTVFQF